MIVNVEKNEVDYLQSKLPESLRADRPEEVGTVVQVERWQKVVGHYGDPPQGSASQNFAKISLVDFIEHQTIDEQEFPGSDPPATSPDGISQSGGETDDVILNYLNGLSQK